MTLPDLSALLPQAAPMVLLDRYEPPQNEKAVVAWVDVTPASPFFDRELGGVPSCVALEYMAQAMALVVGLAHWRKGEKPQLGFVLGSRRFETFAPVFTVGSHYRVSACCTYEDESFGSFDCVVADEKGSVRAKATLSAFQPGGEMTPEQLSQYAG